MGRRKSNETPHLDSLMCFTGNNRRPQMKLCDTMTRDLQICQSTLDDAKSIVEKISRNGMEAHDSTIQKVCYIERPEWRNTLPLPMPQMQSGMFTPAFHHHRMLSLRHMPDQMTNKKGDFEDALGADVFSVCDAGSDPPTPFPCSEPPDKKHSNIEVLNQSASLIFAMQQQQFSKLPCPEVVAMEASRIFSSFLKRLTEHGLVIDPVRSSSFVQNFMVAKSGAGFQREQDVNMGADDARIPNTHNSGPEVKVASEREFFGGEEQVEANEDTADFFQFEKPKEAASESDDDDDGLKRLWQDMAFSLTCMNEQGKSGVEPGNKENHECNHDFFVKDDVGMVCSHCGLVGQDIETIYNFMWGNGFRRKQRKTRLLEKELKTALKDSDGLEESPMQQITQPLILHPLYSNKMHVHQKDGFNFLQCNLARGEPSGCILAHAPGTGKSFLIIAFLQSFQRTFPEERPLIIAPKGMLSFWVREFLKWKVEDISLLNLYEAHSTSRHASELKDYEDTHVRFQHRYSQLQMLREWKAQKSVLLVGYPMFSSLVSDHGTTFSSEIKKILLEVPGLLILDEGHFPRNKCTRILKSLSQVHTKRRVLLSGTLFQNNFDELFNLYHLVRPDFMASNASCTKILLEELMKKSSSPLKTSKTTLSKSTKKRSSREEIEHKLFEGLGDTIMSGEKEERKGAISQLRQLSQPFVHWYKGQVLQELPGLIDLTITLKLTNMQEDALSFVQTKVENPLDRGIKSAMVCIHPSLLKMKTNSADNDATFFQDRNEDPRNSAKTKFVLNILHLCVPLKEKILLFCQYLPPLYLLERMLGRTWGWNLNKEILRIVGKMSLEERETMIDRFNQDPKARILFASIKTCGEGVSLIGASRIVLLDIQWNPAVTRQAISRAFRIGQKKKVFVYRLVGAGAMEEDAHFKACKKEWLAKQIFEGSNDEDYAAFFHEVNPPDVDTYFESADLMENVVKCFRCCFV